MLNRASRIAIVVCCFAVGVAWVQNAPADDGMHPFDLRPQPWQQRQPVLSALATKQTWCRVVLYSPAVLFGDGKFRIWYIGTSAGSRGPDMAVGYAQSDDGIHWTEHPDNPILTDDDIPWGEGWQTPFVLFDQDEQIYKMWFSATSKLMYYAARSWDNSYIDGKGRKRFDGAGVYASIGLAVIPRKAPE